MRIRTLVVLITCFYAGILWAYIVDGSRVNQPRLLSFAKTKLKNKGTIQQAANGGTYLKISDQYIYDLIRQVKKQGFELPNSGALIDFIAADEAIDLNHMAELGATVEFQPLGFYTIVQDDQEFFMLAVEAPILSSLRQKYGLSEKLEDHEFKLVVGVRQLEKHDELVD